VVVEGCARFGRFAILEREGAAYWLSEGLKMGIVSYFLLLYRIMSCSKSEIGQLGQTLVVDARPGSSGSQVGGSNPLLSGFIRWFGLSDLPVRVVFLSCGFSMCKFDNK